MSAMQELVELFEAIHAERCCSPTCSCGVTSRIEADDLYRRIKEED